MSTQRWHSHHSHAASDESGGMEHLETDIMRFMAILAFCLVAIFALVQSIPMQSPEESEPLQVEQIPAEAEIVLAQKPASELENRPSVNSNDVEAQPPRVERSRAIVRPPVAKPKRAVAEERVRSHNADPKPKAVQAPPVRKPVRPQPMPIEPREQAPTAPRSVERQVAQSSLASPKRQEPDPQPTTEQIGFSLRFESDDALKRLVDRDAVSLYAFANRKVWRMMIVGGRLSFRLAQKPTSFHEMAAATVPDDVVRTLRQAVTVSSENLKWGVTLPASTSGQLAKYVSTNKGGDLVIDSAGGLRLERS